MKTIEEIALSVAYKCFSDYADDRVTTLTFMTGKDEVLKFAQKFLAAWLEQQSQEPVAWRYTTPDGLQGVTREKLTLSGHTSQPLFLAPPPAIPEGYVLVPKEPTRAMLAVISNEHEVYNSAESLYQAMLKAAQGEYNASTP